ncbi:hypothetical protein [Streptomyces fragilis]|uniref:Uncharacterized protein n=1 Tax=Streptomyces fragilis TaxID=67301 RepID=A0ABV2YC97_9ACTN|nr:hypothetical protein [Streptomyces fragilis]
MIEPDYRLDGYAPADTWIKTLFRQVFEMEQHTLAVLAEHHTPDNTHSYFLLHDTAATWGPPNTPQVLALHLRRDTTASTYRFEHARLPLAAMAQSWLIQRGCPADAIMLGPDVGTDPADDTTRALEQRVREDADRFSFLDNYIRDDPDDMVTLVVLRSRDESDPARIRVLCEEADLDAGTHTLREGGFANVADALDWCEARLDQQEVYLPPVDRVNPRTTGPAPRPPAPPARSVPGRSR